MHYNVIPAKAGIQKIIQKNAGSPIKSFGDDELRYNYNFGILNNIETLMILSSLRSA